MISVTQFFRRPGRGAYSIERLYADVRSHIAGDLVVSVFECPHLSKGFRPRISNMLSARAAQGDINHITGDVHYLALVLDGSRTILTVHDTVSLGRLRGLRRFFVWLFWYFIPVHLSKTVVVISESTRSQLITAVPGCEQKLRVIHNPVSPEFTPSKKTFDSSRPVVLVVGTGPNKNLERIAVALSTIECELRIIGAPTEAQCAAFDLNNLKYSYADRLTREQVVNEYKNCDLLLFCSTYEGFGLPIVEANAVGRVVVTSNILSMPEVAGDAACFVDPFDVASIRAGVRQVIEDGVYRSRLIAAGLANVKRFELSRIAAQYSELYRQAYSARAHH